MIKAFKNKIKRCLEHLILSKTILLYENQAAILKNQEHLLIQNGKIFANANLKKSITHISEAEFKVFSQWGDDGIIQYLINSLHIKNKTFIEFGVEDYSESNTRFLLFNNNWSGLIMDGSAQNISKIKDSYYYWKYDLKAKTAFITAENINTLIQEENFDKELGLLHIDIDGNDYWVWKAIEAIQPVIVIVEYNCVFGLKPVTVPYKPDFFRTKAHYSNLYAGASLKSLYDLGIEKGYKFIGCNSAGNNAYFVKEEHLGRLKPLSLKEGFVTSKFRESRDEKCNLTYMRGEERLKCLKGLPVYNTSLNKIEVL